MATRDVEATAADPLLLDPEAQAANPVLATAVGGEFQYHTQPREGRP
ncbi:hypothetical protein [Streptomyces cavernicola]|uniref:Uncharacterized protein n=1 Tax=Streptomyces cavernicola TaxID=3043613 RepID=A0ABT6SAF0_9ACTN|nr:hypothetical protein [Streptomyces sp. B-S-A6]MDI3405160.1 hypothetical protein [Streptomyces sp. B-S-A6]